MLDHPFFRIAPLSIERIASAGPIPKLMATDGVSLYYNPDFVLKRSTRHDPGRNTGS